MIDYRAGFFRNSGGIAKSDNLVALFGSVARGDQNKDSDIDLLLATDDQRYGVRTVGSACVHHYPWSHLLELSQQGDLFVCHLVNEARALSDPSGKLAFLSESFVLKASYQREIELATDLGWFLFSFGRLLSPSIVAKRIAWCIRTILIAISAQKGRPIFSADKLAHSADHKTSKNLINMRHARAVPLEIFDELKDFLTSLGSTPSLRDRSYASYVKRFRLTNNNVALQTVERGTVPAEYSAAQPVLGRSIWSLFQSMMPIAQPPLSIVIQDALGEIGIELRQDDMVQKIREKRCTTTKSPELANRLSMAIH